MFDMNDVFEVVDHADRLSNSDYLNQSLLTPKTNLARSYYKVNLI